MEDGLTYDNSDNRAGRRAIPVRKIAMADLKAVLHAGFADFMAKPTHLFFLGLIYPLFGLFLFEITLGHGLMGLIYPLIAGFALIGPFAATVLYMVSSCREEDPDVTWKDVFDRFEHISIAPFLGMGVLLTVLFFAWLAIAQVIYQSTFAPVAPSDTVEFISQLFTTPEGLRMIVFGHLAGFIFAVIVLATSVIAFPILLDRHVSLARAVIVSAKAFATNPLQIIAWGIIVVIALVLGCLPLFVGLAITFPVIGHATWHLYRRLVPRE